MSNKFVLYSIVPENRNIISQVYVMETVGGDGKRISRQGRSVAELGVNSRDVEGTDGTKISTIPSPMLDLREGFRLVPVSMHDLARFRRSYLNM
jgi:hypothetical protein